MTAFIIFEIRLISILRCRDDFVTVKVYVVKKKNENDIVLSPADVYDFLTRNVT